MSQLQWKIYYGDGSMLVGKGPPDRSIDARDIQAIVQDHPEVGVEIVTACDYYVWDDGRWRGVDQFGLYDFLLESGLVLFGRMMKREEYDGLMKHALKDKNGWLPFEVRP